MLPKVANHIIHHTGRAVAAVQNQTSHTIRNVLQLQTSAGPSSTGNLGSWNGSGSSSSGWGGSGPGTGGAKQHSSSRFHTGYTGLGRTATQADLSASNAVHERPDDIEDTQGSRRTGSHSRVRSRPRSSSLTFAISDHDDLFSKSGVLKAVQLHIRSRHAFAPATSPISTIEPSTESEAATVTPKISDSALTEDSVATDGSFAALKAARESGDASLVLAEVEKIRSHPTPTTAIYNAALQALASIRQPGEPLHTLLSTYNDMVARSVPPNLSTYSILILALTERDYEVATAIQSLQRRLHRRTITGRPGANTVDEQRLANLQAENNLGSALALFHAACLTPRSRLSLTLYVNLLRSCSWHGNVNGAIRVFAQLERHPEIQPSALVFKHLITTYTNAGDLDGAKEVFEEYNRKIQSNSLMHETAVDEASGLPFWRTAQMAIWNKMIEAHFQCGQPAGAIDLLEQMMDTSSSQQSSELGVVPPPSSFTFYRVIEGFCQSGDIKSALSWFDRLLSQDGSPTTSRQPTLIPTRPNKFTWVAMLEGLAQHNMIKDLNRLFDQFVQTAHRDALEISSTDCALVALANIHHLDTHTELDSAEAVNTLDFVANFVCESSNHGERMIESLSSREVYQALVALYLRHGSLERAVTLALSYVDTIRGALYNGESEAIIDSDTVLTSIRYLQHTTNDIMRQFLPSSSEWTLGLALRFAETRDRLRLPPTPVLTLPILATFARASDSEKDLLTPYQWGLLLFASAGLRRAALKNPDYELNAEPPVSLLELLSEMAKRQVSLDSLSRGVPPAVGNVLSLESDKQHVSETLQSIGYTQILDKYVVSRETGVQIPQTSTTGEASDSPQPVTDRSIRIDFYHSKFVDEYFPTNPDITPTMAYERFLSGTRVGVYPAPEVIGRLINSLGRLGELDKVGNLYSASQNVLASLDHDKQRQSIGWFQIEDQMIVALAHAGDTDAAHIHRTRILEQGGAPSADAYGALIQCVKDTTDDTSNAMSLFQEAIARGVTPNIYLYNTAISKLAKARKADHALELFQEMKNSGIRPTSVTYGAVIAACCRVGDAQSAELLFQEMSSQPNFKPRVPPYNTMMQLYTHTKPDRERVLYYYNALLDARVRPTAHTYKLLIDAYGTIEPANIEAMEDTFNRLVANPHVPVQGTHWAALINAYGCVRKDLDKAVSIFESIAQHPTSKQSTHHLPDAVVFEALMNVLVTLRRTDLIPTYTAKLSSYGIHMTAYIANLLIKGYAAAGDIVQARSIFEGLSDPAEGVAAPNNHAPHDNESSSSSIPISAPVYREPSTWESMVRAELGNGNRDEAVNLLERVKARRFPPAVYNRISGIMLDDSVSPWAKSPESSSPSSP